MRVGVIDGADSRALRRRVLRPNLAAGAPLPGDDVPDTVHFGAVDDDGAVVSTCFVFAEDCEWRPELPGAWRLRSMATAPERQGQGIGRAVVAATADYLAARGVPLVWCIAREDAGGFWQRQGFVPYGPVFLDSEMRLPHRRMSRELRPPPTSS